MLGFGKYRGKTLNEVAAVDQEYMNWLAKHELINNQGTLYIKNDSERIGFGKYIGKTWAEIHAINPGYVDWLKKNAVKADGSPKFKFAVEQLEALREQEIKKEEDQLMQAVNETMN